MPTQIQLRAVKTVEIEPEGAVPPSSYSAVKASPAETWCTAWYAIVVLSHISSSTCSVGRQL